MQEEYTKYYKKLLKTRGPDNEIERLIEEEVNKNVQEIIKQIKWKVSLVKWLKKQQPN